MKKYVLSIIMSMLTINILNMSTLTKVLSLILLVLFYYFVLDKIKITKKSLIFSIVLSFCYTFCNVLGAYLCSDFSLKLTYMLSMFVSEIIIFTFACLFLFGKRNINTSIKRKKIDDIINHKHFKLFVMIFLFLCHLPAFIAAFPGVFAYDAPNQFSQFVTGELNNFQPVFSSFVLYSVIKTGKFLFSSWEGGLAFFIVLQMILCFYVIAYLCEYLKKRKANSIFIIITILFFGLLPIHHLFTINAGKDTIFSFMFLYLVVIIAELVENPKEFLQSPKKIIQIILVTLVVLFYRNNAIYVWTVTAIILLIVLKKYRIKWSIVVGFTIIPYLLITHPLYNYLGIPNANIREMMSVPTQSIVRIYLNNKNIGKKYEKQIKYFFDADSKKILKEKYHPYNGDGTKFQLNDEKLKSHKKEFIGLFLNLSMRYPKDFIDAWLYNTVGYWYPNTPSFAKEISFVEYRNSIYPVEMMTKRYNFIPVLSRYYENLGQTEKSIEYLGVFSPLGSMGFVFFVYLFLIFYTIYKKRYKLLLVFLPLCLLWGTNLLGPVVIYRYIYPLFISLPLFISALFYEKR